MSPNLLPQFGNPSQYHGTGFIGYESISGIRFLNKNFFTYWYQTLNQNKTDTLILEMPIGKFESKHNGY
jgi:hypothetical protein